MRFVDRSLVGKAKAGLTGLVDKHGDKVAGGIDKAAGALNRKTKGKHADKIQRGSAAAKNALDNLDRKNDDIR